MSAKHVKELPEFTQLGTFKFIPDPHLERAKPGEQFFIIERTRDGVQIGLISLKHELFVFCQAVAIPLIELLELCQALDMGKAALQDLIKGLESSFMS